MSTVTVERDADIWIVTLNRPAARNAVDGPTALVLADSYLAFDAGAVALRNVGRIGNDKVNGWQNVAPHGMLGRPAQ